MFDCGDSQIFSNKIKTNSHLNNNNKILSKKQYNNKILSTNKK